MQSNAIYYKEIIKVVAYYPKLPVNGSLKAMLNKSFPAAKVSVLVPYALRRWNLKTEIISPVRPAVHTNPSR